MKPKFKVGDEVIDISGLNPGVVITITGVEVRKDVEHHKAYGKYTLTTDLGPTVYSNLEASYRKLTKLDKILK